MKLEANATVNKDSILKISIQWIIIWGLLRSVSLTVGVTLVSNVVLLIRQLLLGKLVPLCYFIGNGLPITRDESTYQSNRGEQEKRWVQQHHRCCQVFLPISQLCVLLRCLYSLEGFSRMMTKTVACLHAYLFPGLRPTIFLNQCHEHLSHPIVSTKNASIYSHRWNWVRGRMFGLVTGSWNSPLEIK